MSNSEEKYGKKIEYDPLWKGPMQNARSPTDRLWLNVFLVYVAVYIAAGIYGGLSGDLRLFTAPTDYAGRTCGVDLEVQDKPFLLYIKLTESALGLETAPSVCVAKCPSENFLYQMAANVDPIDELKEKLICTTDINMTLNFTLKQLDTLVAHEKCTDWYLESEPIMDICLPSNAWHGHESETITQESLDKVRKIIRINQEFNPDKFVNNSKAIINPAIIAMVFGGIIALIYVVLLRWFAIPFFYASICMFCSFIIFGIYSLCVSYSKTNNGSELFVLILLVLLVVGIIIAVIYFRKKIYLACQLIKESSKAVMHISVSLIFPILPSLLYICTVAFSIYIFLNLFTITTSNYQIEKLGNEYTDDGCKCTDTMDEDALYTGARCDPIVFNNSCKAFGQQPCQFLQCRLYSKTSPAYVNFLHSINIVGFLWILFFISGFEYMVLGGTFASWYWTYNKNNVSQYALIDSTRRTIRYHMGTIAVGSLILTISQIIRLILQAIQNKFREANNAIAGGFMCCFRQFYDTLDTLLNFLNYNAYIMCAIHGKSFLQSAKSAFHLIMRNIVKVVVVNTVVDWLFAMAKLLITSISVGGIMWYYSDNDSYDPSIFGAQVTLSIICTYIIASVFFSVQGIAANTIFLCFIEDSERNDGSDDRPYYMSDKLKSLLHK